MRRFGFVSLALTIGLQNFVPSATGQTQYRRFTRTPYYTGPNDPERGKSRGTLKFQHRHRVAVIELMLQHWPKVSGHNYKTSADILASYSVPGHLRDDV